MASAMFIGYVGRVNEVDFSALTDETNDGDAQSTQIG
jgi:hypothetical protein